MPPPKKPKSGPTTIEQFMSTDELTPEERRARTGSCSGSSEASDVSAVSEVGSEKIGLENGHVMVDDPKAPGLRLLRELIIKKREDEQRVPGSDVSMNGSSKSVSPSDIEISQENEKKTIDTSDVVSAKAVNQEQLSNGTPSPVSPMAGSVLPAGSFEKNLFQKPLKANSKSSPLHSPKHHSPSVTSYASYFAPYLYGQSLTNAYLHSTPESEPTDLSLKMDKENDTLDNRLVSGATDNLQRDIQERLSFQFDMERYSTAFTDNKDLDARKNLVSILTEPRFNQLGFSMERESNLGSFPFFMNGFDTRR